MRLRRKFLGMCKDVIPRKEIEPTPEMIEAGANELWDSGALETSMDDFDRDLVRKIFLAMSQASAVRS